MVAVFSRPFGAVLLVLAWLTDGVVSQSLTYQFLAPVDFLQSARFGGDLDWHQFFSVWHVAGAVIFSVFLYFCLKYTDRTLGVINPILYYSAVGLLLLILDAANGSSELWSRDKMTVAVNIAGSPELILINSSLMSPAKRGVRKISDDQSIAKKFDVVGWAINNPDRSILFVVVESLGIPKSREASEWLNRSIHIKNFATNYYEIMFRGATTSGELRSLCGLEGSYTSVNASVGSDCLPAQLSKLGWKTTGFHGFSKRMFDRQTWWPAIGLDQTFFIENKEIEILPRCGNVFSGACDKDLLRVAVGSIMSAKSFAYVLTLNTHLPVVPVQIPSSLSAICVRDEIPSAACMHIAALSEVLSNVVYEALSLPRTPLVVAVGDHAPPFATLSDRDSFRQDVISGYVFVPSY
jgi:hypothetical protein